MKSFPLHCSESCFTLAACIKDSCKAPAQPDLRLVCEECEHFFDAADPRASVLNTDEFGPRCPACNIQLHGGTEAWALANDCQGIWGDTIRWTKAEAVELLKDTHKDTESRVIPVRVYEEADSYRIELREYREREWEKSR
ncbi:hypothetical protein HU675_0038470 [Bradyrhizobium septentrionale]|uniref:hypothetical protein n=1 Tax=Bradyrhizobium septentrionale TaxID=1404411 RepID=UPI0015964C1A|nr:hypothetical protein [Bradyrhizobium septentrionale]UGY23772.1 hypothetical protein HU675_0038470 [Bradyrhizobium septentrionale]